MAEKLLKPVQLTLRKHGVERRILSCGADKKGNVFVFPKVSGLHSVGGIPGEKIKQFKLSIHPTPDKPYNTVTSEYLLRDGSTSRFYNYVSAVKNRWGFAPIISVHPSDLSGNRYNPRPNVPTLCLGNCDIDASLFYTVAISYPFSFLTYRSFYNFKTVLYDALQVSILWSFSGLPSSASSRICGQALKQRGGNFEIVSEDAIARPRNMDQLDQEHRENYAMLASRRLIRAPQQFESRSDFDKYSAFDVETQMRLAWENYPLAKYV